VHECRITRRNKTNKESCAATPGNSSAMGVRRKFSRGGQVDILFIIFMLLTMQCKWTFTKRFTISTPQKNDPSYGNNKKCASLAAIPRTQVYCDNLHSRLSADFQSRILLI